MTDTGVCPATARQVDQAFAALDPVGNGGRVAHRPSVAGLQPSQSMFCYGCGGRIHVAAPACPACGAVQARAGAGRARKDRSIAIVLAFLLGGIGVHRFYLGQIWWGLLYLVFFWTFVPAAIAMIEGIVFASTSEVEFHRTYG